MKRFWPFSFYLLQFAGYATVGPFMVLYYQGLGFTGAQIGLLTGIAPLITFVCSPLWTRLADRTGWHRILMSLTMLAGIGVLVAFPLLSGFGAVIFIAVLLNIFLAPITPFVDNATMHMLGERKHLYGRVRLGATIGYGAAAALAGLLVSRFGLRSAFWGCASLFLIAFLVSQRLEHEAGGGDCGVRAEGSMKALLTDARWIAFLALAFGGGLAIASHNYMFSYMKDLGAPEFLMGITLTVGTIAELPVLYFAHRLIHRFSARSVLTLSMVVTGARMLLFAVNSTPEWVLVIQLLNGATFALMWVAGVAYADKHAPPGLSTTSQGMFAAMVNGIGAAVGGLAGGPLLEHLGGRGLYLVYGAIVFLVVGAVAATEAVRASRTR